MGIRGAWLTTGVGSPAQAKGLILWSVLPFGVRSGFTLPLAVVWFPCTCTEAEDFGGGSQQASVVFIRIWEYLVNNPEARCQQLMLHCGIRRSSAYNLLKKFSSSPTFEVFLLRFSWTVDIGLDDVRR